MKLIKILGEVEERLRCLQNWVGGPDLPPMIEDIQRLVWDAKLEVLRTTEEGNKCVVGSADCIRRQDEEEAASVARIFEDTNERPIKTLGEDEERWLVWDAKLEVHKMSEMGEVNESCQRRTERPMSLQEM